MSFQNENIIHFYGQLGEFCSLPLLANSGTAKTNTSQARILTIFFCIFFFLFDKKKTLPYYAMILLK